MERAALIAECHVEEHNCLYTSTIFFIWLRWLKTVRAFLWACGGICSIAAASHILRGDAEHFRIVGAGAALAGVALPALIRTLRLDRMIRNYSASAARFKNLQGEFRRLSLVWSHGDIQKFEQEARRTFAAMSEARKPSLTPPEICFRLARRKIKAGHYIPDKHS